eukprot:CAMPEP_0202913380 /NCGR_PEP_ID=MMETSP1392-20130828/60355_1 /ASSEMBLY_ACC=CAM_ASM_000868 /TAXON_ID=225041 /ORGANISM="Chlamydomonas chlamydogama, Strain SAG 11-48b" /LENGTH=75 /DNA_ID=CAMNT_0049604621 /DNA_START=49 /DNA_END=274 /DNA_ORIENTATION=-
MPRCTWLMKRHTSSMAAAAEAELMPPVAMQPPALPTAPQHQLEIIHAMYERQQPPQGTQLQCAPAHVQAAQVGAG